MSMPEYAQAAYTGKVYKQELYFPTWKIPADHPLVLLGRRRLRRRSTASAPVVDKWTFSTNGVAICGRHKIPVIGFGPGDEAQAHAPNEINRVDDLEKASAFYAALPYSLERSVPARPQRVRWSLSLPELRGRVPDRAGPLPLRPLLVAQRAGHALWAASSNAPSTPMNAYARREHSAGCVPARFPCRSRPSTSRRLPVGDTPLWAPARLRAKLGFPGLWLKDDTCEPSGSYKDRASFLVAAFARKHGIERGRPRLDGQRGLEHGLRRGGGGAQGDRLPAKVGARRQAGPGTPIRGRAARDRRQLRPGLRRSAWSTRHRTGVLSRNTAYNPLTIEGKKTAAFEIVRDLSRARASAGLPTMSSCPRATASSSSGVIRGFEDLLALGRDRADADGLGRPGRGLERDCPGPRDRARFEFRPSTTLADSISVDAPRNGLFALAKLQRHGGPGDRRLGRGDPRGPETGLLAGGALRGALERLRPRRPSSRPGPSWIGTKSRL